MQAIDRICDYYYSLQSRPVVPTVQPGYLKEHLPPNPPEEGENFELIADDYQKYIVPGLTHWQHPSFFAYFPVACTFEGMIADLYSSSACNPGFNWNASPACTELEVLTMDWAARLLGLSPAFYNSSGIGGGAIQSTASESAIIAVVAARSRFQTENPEVRLEDLIIYTTTQTHSIGLKAGRVLGLSVRPLDVTPKDQFSLRGETLRAALEEDERNGKKPFILIATVGTTSSGAVDNLKEIQLVAKNYPSLWIHIDAAWAGIALCCPEYRGTLYLNEINECADSFCTNFHKWGLVNFYASTLWVRNRRHLTDALDVTPPYLRTKEYDAGVVIDYRNWQLSLGRGFRSLKLWFVIRSYGVKGFQEYIRKTISLNQQFAEMISRSHQFTLVTPPSLALTVFRIEPQATSSEQPGHTLEVLNDLNRRFHERLSARTDVMFTQTMLNGVFCIRMAVGTARTELHHINKAFDLLCEEADKVLQE